MLRLRDYYTGVLQHEPNGIKEPEEIYYPIEFHDETKRLVNPFKLQNFLSDNISKCNQKVEELTSDSKNRFSFKVYPFIENPIEPIFMKSRNSTAVLLTFNLQEQSYSIYISPDKHQIPLYTSTKFDT